MSKAIKTLGLTVLFALAFALGTTPVLGATKLIDVREHNVTLTGSAVVAGECGVNGIVTLVLHVQDYHFTYWSNNHFTLSVFANLKIYESSGSLVAFSEAGNATYTAGTGSLPLNSQTNGVLHCTGASPTPHQTETFHYGFTIGTRGQLVQFKFITS